MEEKIEEEIFLSTRKFNEDEAKVNLGQQSCTDMKTNRRVFFPPGRPAKEEAMIEVRKRMWTDIVTEYMEANCDAEGKQKVKQLDQRQERGLKKIMRRVNKGGINVSQADKGKSVVVMPMALYQQMTATHTSKDEEVTWSRLEEAQKLVRSHTRSLARIFKLGSSKGETNEARCFENSLSWACDPPY